MLTQAHEPLGHNHVRPGTIESVLAFLYHSMALVLLICRPSVNVGNLGPSLDLGRIDQCPSSHSLNYSRIGNWIFIVSLRIYQFWSIYLTSLLRLDFMLLIVQSYHYLLFQSFSKHLVFFIITSHLPNQEHYPIASCFLLQMVYPQSCSSASELN